MSSKMKNWIVLAVGAFSVLLILLAGYAGETVKVTGCLW